MATFKGLFGDGASLFASELPRGSGVGAKCLKGLELIPSGARNEMRSSDEIKMYREGALALACRTVVSKLMGMSAIALLPPALGSGRARSVIP